MHSLPSTPEVSLSADSTSSSGTLLPDDPWTQTIICEGLECPGIWSHAESWNKHHLILNRGTRACPTRRGPSWQSSGEKSTPWAWPGKRGDLLSWHPVWSVLTPWASPELPASPVCRQAHGSPDTRGLWLGTHRGRLTHNELQATMETWARACLHVFLSLPQHLGAGVSSPPTGEGKLWPPAQGRAGRWIARHRPVPLSTERLPGL